jgi:CO dehydrogenase/acetyl-CoA synthase gamma subunit (corrinoid Fe-S protein)
MNNNTKGIIAVGVVAAIVLAVILITKDKKESYAMTIIKAGKAGNYLSLITFDVEFLKAWAEAVKNKQDTFFVQGRNHNTQGGRSTT